DDRLPDREGLGHVSRSEGHDRAVTARRSSQSCAASRSNPRVSSSRSGARNPDARSELCSSYPVSDLSCGTQRTRLFEALFERPCPPVCRRVLYGTAEALPAARLLAALVAELISIGAAGDLSGGNRGRGLPAAFAPGILVESAGRRGLTCAV